MIPHSLLPFLHSVVHLLFCSFFGITCTNPFFISISYLLSQQWQRDKNPGQPNKKHTHIQRATSTFLWNSWVYGFGNTRTRPGIPSLDEVDAYGIMGTWQYVMIYGFGIIGLGLGLGSFCRLLSSSGFLLFYLFSFWLLIRYIPLLFFFLFAFCFLETPLVLHLFLTLFSY